MWEILKSRHGSMTSLWCVLCAREIYFVYSTFLCQTKLHSYIPTRLYHPNAITNSTMQPNFMELDENKTYENNSSNRYPQSQERVHQFKPKMMRTNSKNRICMQTNEIVENALKRAHLFSFWWGRWGQHCVGMFLFHFFVPMCSHMFPKFLMCSQQHHTFYSMWFAKGEVLHLHVETSILEVSKVSKKKTFFELMGQSKWFSVIKF